MYLHEDKQVFKETIEQVFIKEISQTITSYFWMIMWLIIILLSK